MLLLINIQQAQVSKTKWKILRRLLYKNKIEFAYHYNTMI